MVAKSKKQSALNVTIADEQIYSASNAYVLSCFDNEDGRFTKSNDSTTGGIELKPYFAAISLALDVYRLRVFDTNNGKLIWETSWPLAQVCTCLSFGTLMTSSNNSSGQNQQQKKKRKANVNDTKSSQNEDEEQKQNKIPQKMISVGFQDGTIKFFSIQEGSLYKTLTGTHSDAVTDIVIMQDGDRAFTSSMDGLIVEWNIHSGVVLRKINTNLQSLYKIQISHDGQKLLAADHDMTLFSLETNEKIKSWTGHASRVIQMQFSQDDKYFISCAEQDRCISIWDCSPQATDVNIAVLRMELAAIRLSLCPDMHVMALDESGAAHIWMNVLEQQQSEKDENNSGKKSKKSKKASLIRPLQPIRKISFVDEQTKKSTPINAATFEGNKKILTVTGMALKPYFEKVLVVHDDADKIEPELILSRSFKQKQSLINNGNGAQSTKETNGSNEKVLGTNDFRVAMPSLPKSSVSEKSTTQNAQDDELKPNEEPSLEEKLNNIQLSSGKEYKVNDKSQSKSSTAPTSTTSLYSLLTQAIHTNDKELLEKCLNIRDPKVLLHTCNRLSITHVVPFLEQILARVQENHNRASKMIEWVRAVIIAHAAYLMTVPDMAQKLGALYQTLDARITNYEKLVKLSGRLDLVMSSIRIRREQLSAAQKGPLRDQTVVYDEEVDDDVDSMSEDEEEDEIIGDDVGFDYEDDDEIEFEEFDESDVEIEEDDDDDEDMLEGLDSDEQEH